MNKVSIKIFQKILQVPYHCWCQFKLTAPKLVNISTKNAQNTVIIIFSSKLGNFQLMITVLSNLFEKLHHTRKVNIAVPKKTQKVKKKNDLKGQLILKLIKKMDKKQIKTDFKINNLYYKPKKAKKSTRLPLKTKTKTFQFKLTPERYALNFLLQFLR